MKKILGLNGANNTIEHQLIIAELLYAFVHKSKTTKKYSKYISLPEIGISTKIPDIVVYNYKYEAIAIFEVCISNGLKKDISKCQKLMEIETTIKESFVIDISKAKPVINKMIRLKSGKISTPKKNSKFETLNIELGEHIKSS